MDERQLEWVSRNRVPRRKAETIGALLARARQRAPLKVPPWRPRIVSVLAAVADPTLAEHAWVLAFRAGVVILGVDEAGLVGALRMRWHRVLRERFEACLPDLGVVDVRFRYAVPPAPPAPRVSPEEVERWAEEGRRDGAGAPVPTDGPDMSEVL